MFNDYVKCTSNYALDLIENETKKKEPEHLIRENDDIEMG